jgi:hypothetical protein
MDQAASAAVPHDLTAKAVSTALDPQLVPAPVAELSNGVIRIMLAKKLKAVPLVLALLVASAYGGRTLLAETPADAPSAAIPLAVAGATTAPVPPEADQPRRDVSAPVIYEDLMLVLVTKEGAAAVVFHDPAADGNGVSYKFRYQSADGKTHKTGSGMVVERKLDDGSGYDETLLDIKAGPIALHWSRGNPVRGWIYYSPEVMQVHMAHADSFEVQVKMFGLQRLEIEALDLKRFMPK